MFKIIITTDEYMNGQCVSTESVHYYRRYKTRAAAGNNAAKMGCIIQAPCSPLKYITTVKVIEVNHA